MSTKKVWTRNEIVQLIEKYEQHRELWDTKCKEYRDKFKKNAILQSLATEFNTTDNEITRKLHNLKTQFGQELKKEQQRKSGQGSNEIYTSRWEFYQMLKFTTCQHTLALSDDSMVIKNTINNSRHLFNYYYNDFEFIHKYLNFSILPTYFTFWSNKIIPKLVSN